jgi:hypothetical protein
MIPFGSRMSEVQILSPRPNTLTYLPNVSLVSTKIEFGSLALKGKNTFNFSKVEAKILA